MRLNTPSLGVGFALMALGLGGVFLVMVLALLAYGAGFAPMALALAVGLLLIGVGLYKAYCHVQDMQEESRRMSLIAEMNVQVNREILLNEDIELIYRTILNYLFSVFEKATTGSILILGEDRVLTFAASRGFTEEFVNRFRLRLEDTFLYQATGGDIKHARLITREDFLRLETIIKPEEWEYKSVISAPLFVGDRLFGLLNLDSPVSGTYDREDVEIVERFRTQIEVGLLARERYTANIKRYQVDPLTGLLTRRYFEDLFKRSLDRAVRQKETFVLALFDLDKLKTVNDTLGHLAGDQMLLAIANGVRTSCRQSDIIGRLGGDEFIACYYDSDWKVMDKNIAAIRAKVRAKPLRFGESEFSVSFSYGLAKFPEDGADYESLVAVADKRLYAMKTAGR